MNSLGEKEVDFFKWCPLCKHKDKKESDEPCRDCLEETSNTHSTKPVRLEEKEK